MNLVSLKQELSGNTYPGRGIVIGKTEDGRKAAIAYFIMGRSVNSRNRVFTETEDGFRTEAKDPALLSDPSLVIYRPLRRLGDRVIVTNGDQTDTVWEALKAGRSFEDALRTREFEPDPPNFTPRISGLVTLESGDFRYQLSILKSANGNPGCCERFFYDYPAPIAGEGRFIHTYLHDGNPIPSFEGDPTRVVIGSDFDAFTKEIWDNLNADNKVSLYTCMIDLASGSREERITNRY